MRGFEVEVPGLLREARACGVEALGGRDQALQEVRAQGGLVGIPHPFDRLHAIPDPATLHRHLADIVTNSYGYGGEALPPGYIKPQEDTYIQAAAEGMSLFFSSGDDGDETGGDPTATPTPDSVVVSGGNIDAAVLARILAGETP